MAPLCKARRPNTPLVQRGEMKGGIVPLGLHSIKIPSLPLPACPVSVFPIENRLSYPLRLALLDTSPLSKRGGMGGWLRTISPYYKEARNRRLPLTIRGSIKRALHHSLAIRRGKKNGVPGTLP